MEIGSEFQGSFLRRKEVAMVVLCVGTGSSAQNKVRYVLYYAYCIVVEANLSSKSLAKNRTDRIPLPPRSVFPCKKREKRPISIGG
jgi:hypothetical protein